MKVLPSVAGGIWPTASTAPTTATKPADPAPREVAAPKALPVTQNVVLDGGIPRGSRHAGYWPDNDLHADLRHLKEAEALGIPRSAWHKSGGRVSASASAFGDGFIIDVRVDHRYPKENVVLLLDAKLVDRGKEHVVTLGALAVGTLNPNCELATEHRFFVSYDAINAYVQTHNPALKFEPGCPLAVAGVWPYDQADHNSGCFGAADATFTTPLPATQKPHQLRVGVVTEHASKPLELSLRIPAEIAAKYPHLLATNASVLSRLEHEMKLSVDEASLDTACKRLLALAADPAAQAVWLEETLGEKGWTLEVADRYFVKDEHGDYVQDPASGLPQVVPMEDVYLDGIYNRHLEQKSFWFASSEAAVRWRDGEIKAGRLEPTMGKLNVKPTSGVTNEDGVTSRIEITLDTLPGAAHDPKAAEELAAFCEEATPPLSPAIGSASALKGRQPEPIVWLIDRRHKFVLVRNDGLKIELSLDNVRAETLHPELADEATGEPRRATFCQVEMELDHVEATGSAEVATDFAVADKRKAEQVERGDKNVLANASPEATFNAAPVLHTISDLNLLELGKDPSYRSLSRAARRLRDALFAQHAPGKQKCAEALDVMRLLR